MVEQYSNSCNYKNLRLKKKIYLAFDTAKINVLTDDGHALAIWEDTETPLLVSILSISLDEQMSLDERYAFQHQVTFTVNGYANYNYFGGRNVVILEDEEGTFWLINPKFPMKITYNYTLNSSRETTTFTFSIKSNHPLLRLEDFTGEETNDCHYTHCTFKNLRLNEQQYSTKNGNSVQYSNSGFKGIEYLPNSASLSENYDGEIITTSIEFILPMSSYLSSWHYNLLEFAENKYSAIVETTDGSYILSGFLYGLQPSYRLQGENAETDKITVTLTNTGEFIQINDEDNLSYNDSFTWEYTTLNNAYECTGKNTAKYLLQQELNAFSKPTGRYMALSGYENYFPKLNIIGTFQDIVTFACPQCQSSECGIITSLPDEITFNEIGDKKYTIDADSPWSINSSNSGITVSPSNGNAGHFEITVSNTISPFSGDTTARLSLDYCSQSRRRISILVTAPSCLTAGNEFGVSSSEQIFKVPYICPVERVRTELNYSIKNGGVAFNIPANKTTSAITYNIKINDDDITIIQTQMYSRWVADGNACNNLYSYCERQRLYSGRTSTNINTPTEITRLINCSPSVSSKCLENKRWVETTDTYCAGGTKYTVEEEQTTTDGSTWYGTGYKRLGQAMGDSTDCSEPVETWEAVPNDYLCNYGNKYQKLELYLDGVAQAVYKRGMVLEEQSTDCGYVPRALYEQWVEAGPTCDGYNRYGRERLYQSPDGERWRMTNMFRMTDIIEVNSTNCGYSPQFDYRWVETAMPICFGTSSYYAYKKQRAPHNSAIWEDIVPTVLSVDADGTESMVIADEDSPECGYKSPIIPTYKWELVVGYLCDGCQKNEKYQKFVSWDDGDTWSPLNEYIPGQEIEEDSPECGCGEEIQRD